MSRIAAVAAIVAAFAGCGRSDTGVHIVVHLGTLEYDELRFQVTRSSAGMADETVVDPATNGRYAGPFAAGDQDVTIYMSDDYGGSQLRCEASALRGGVVAGSGATDVTIVRGAVKDVEIFMAGSGGDGGTGGSTGAAGSTGAGGATGTGGSPPPPGKANGDACSLGAECVTGHCVDGACCESDCRTACHSCGLADSRGLCRPVAAGLPDPRAMCSDKGPASCQTTGLCGVAGDCAVYPAGTACGVGDCADMGKTAVPARVCDGTGKCEAPGKIKCPEQTTCVAGVCTEVQDPP